MIYCIDACSLISAWKDNYPPDHFQTLWDKLDSLIDEGRLLSSKEVLLELERQDDNLHLWAEARQSIFLEADIQTQRCVSQIVTAFPTFVPETSPDGVWADPYLIAISKTRRCILVTGEKLAGPGAKRPKIPNICNEMGIQWCTIIGLIRLEGWQF